MRPLKLEKQKGQVFIVVALSMVVLIGSVGLAIDSGLGYMVKAKLNAAADSAAIAGARAVAQGTDRTKQEKNATEAAEKFFAANYPDGYLGSKLTLTTVAFPSVEKPGQVAVKIDASVDLPVSFMRVMGFKKLDIAASAETLRRDLDMAFVIDTTGSMETTFEGVYIPTAVKNDSISFLKRFSQNDDRVALIRFAYGAVVMDKIETDARGFALNSMIANIGALKVAKDDPDTDFEGTTNSAEGFWKARRELKGVKNPSGLRIIVFLSDGAPNSFSSFFPFKNVDDCTLAGTISTNDSTSKNWPTGLRDPYLTSEKLGGKCWQDNNIIVKIPPKRPQNNSIVHTDNLTYVTKLPDWYNAHDITDKEFPIVSAIRPEYAPREVTNDVSTEAMAWRNVNRASRNLLEAMAAKSRDENIYVFTLGLGNYLDKPTGPDKEKGEDLLKCIANDPTASGCKIPSTPGQPVGIYCRAPNEVELKRCFEQFASAILKITK